MADAVEGGEYDGEPKSKKQRLELETLETRREHEHSALVKDPIHGSIKLDPLLHWITKTPAFHRLKYIKQLSGLHYVYPGGTHTRFEHSIGVCYLAGEYAQMLIKKYREDEDKLKPKGSIEETTESSVNGAEDSQKELEKKLNEAEKKLKEIERKHEEDRINILCIQIAGLCHDLGHGPFSHLFEVALKEIREASAYKKKESGVDDGRSELKFKHEKMSVRILETLIYDKEFFESHYGITFTHFQNIKDMIERPTEVDSQTSTETSLQEKDREDLFLYQIVANKETGIDVDKWDYFIRDCHYIGLQHEFDCKRMMQLSKVCRVEEEGKKTKLRICYNKKEINNLLGMFRTRCSLHLKAYQHRRVKAVNRMLMEAIKEVFDLDIIYDRRQQKKRSIEDIIRNCDSDLEGYLALDDGIIHVILNTDPRSFEKEEQQKQLKKAQKWLTDLYDGKNIPRRLPPEEIIKNLGNDVRHPHQSQQIFDAMKEHKYIIENEFIDASERKRVFCEIVDLSYISEDKDLEGNDLKDKTCVFSSEHVAKPAETKTVFSPLAKVYVYKDDMKSDGQSGESSISATLLQESQYEETLPLFIPERYKMKQCWWYTTLDKTSDDEIMT